MNKICVYTCITGNYDSLKDIKYKDKNIDYICFTNNKELKSDDWQIKFIDEDYDNLTLARKVKILGYKYLKEYELNIWMDGAINILKPISEFLKNKCDLNKFDMIGFKHQKRDCIYDEINECVHVGKETVNNALKLENFLLKEKYPKHNGLIESTVLVRKNNKEVNKLMDDWFNMILNYSRRDQLSFDYVLWKNPIKINILDIYVYDNEYFLHDQHNDKKLIKKYNLYLGDSKNFDFHNCINGKYTINKLREGIKIKLPKDTDRLELTIDEIGNFIKSVKINKKAETTIYNICDIRGKKVFYDLSVIAFDGNFKKNDELIFKIDIEELDYLSKLKLIYEGYLEVSELNKKNNELNESFTTVVNISDILKKENEELKKQNSLLNEELQKMLNSKSWKITKPIRAISNFAKKGK